MRKGIVTFIAFFVVIACSGTTSINIEKYDRTCNNLNDCFVIATDACCGCPIAAINVDSKAQYLSDLAAAKNNCSGMACPNIACQNLVAGCQAGLCITQGASSNDGGSDAAPD